MADDPLTQQKQNEERLYDNWREALQEQARLRNQNTGLWLAVLMLVGLLITLAVQHRGH